MSDLNKHHKNFHKIASVREFVFKAETRTLLISSLLAFAINRFVSDLQGVLVNQMVLTSIKATKMYDKDQIDDLVENTNLTHAPQKVSSFTTIAVALLQLIFNIFIIYLVYIFMDKLEPEPGD